MKTFLITWKTNSNFRHKPSLIRGESFTDAMHHNFHRDAIDAVQLHEEVKPWFMNIQTRAFQYPLPITIYYTQHGTGKIYIKWIDGMVTEEIALAVRNASQQNYRYMNEVAADIYRQVNP